MISFMKKGGVSPELTTPFAIVGTVAVQTATKRKTAFDVQFILSYCCRTLVPFIILPMPVGNFIESFLIDFEYSALFSEVIRRFLMNRE